MENEVSFEFDLKSGVVVQVRAAKGFLEITDPLGETLGLSDLCKGDRVMLMEEISFRMQEEEDNAPLKFDFILSLVVA